MRFKKIKEEESLLGITPLIDIVFLLLIFFMLTSHFNVVSGLSIKLPEFAHKAYGNKGHKIKLAIDRKGQVFFKNERIELKDLCLRLQGIVEKDSQACLVLEADKDVRHGRVVQIMDLAKTSGVYSIIIAARWRPEKVF